MKTLNKRHFRLPSSVFFLRSSNILILCTLSFFLYPLSFISAQHMALDWQQCFGGTDSEYCVDIVEINNEYLILGSSVSTDGDISYNHGGVDVWLIRTDLSGNLLYEKTYGGSHADAGFRLVSTNNSCQYILGTSYSSDGDISNDPYPESTDYWIVKIDSLGTILWEKIVGGNKLDQLWTGTSTSDGGVVAFGWTGSTDGDVSTFYGWYDMWLVKLNSVGEILWDKTIGNSYFDYGQAIIETMDHGFLIGGSSRMQGGGNLTCDPYSDLAEAIIIKLDSLGNIEWQQCYGGSYDEGVTGLLEVEDGYIFTAFVESNDGDVTGLHGTPGDEYVIDIWFVKIDIYGNLLWQKCLGGTRAEFSRNIFQTEDGDFVIIGVTQSNDGDVSGNHTVSELKHDIWMVKLSSDGELLWQQCIGGGGDEIVNFGVIQKSDYRYVIAGQSDWASDDVDCNIHHEQGGPWYPDFWVFEVYDTTVNITETPGDFALKTYPNPAHNYVIFEQPVISSDSEKSPQYNRQSHPVIIITNTLGQQVAQLEVKGNKTVWDTRSIRTGVYFYFLEFVGSNYSGKVVVQK